MKKEAQTTNKLETISTVSKPQIGKESRYNSSSNFNATSIIRKHRQDNVKEIERKLRSTMSKVVDHEHSAQSVK